ncbi:GFA family protein [uncultured Albimonas sp.]|uniref:GFA family protein n=1 Tax=uncultured Albimonas sp. TaxID=1331701 RepID=UPI0030EC47D3|tara:strand:+ start:3345 stop:3773 length:429 start_codon:yes stop_codon:yes gene_type:complete
MAETYAGRCFCGAVTVEVEGEPLVQGFCHCGDCRGWSAAPVTAYSLWPAAKVRITAGEDRLTRFTRDGRTVRRSCAHCGGSVLSEQTGHGLIDVYASILSGFGFAPQAHVHYAERMIDMPDGLPKFRDMPAEAGGSGEMLAD